MSAHALPGTVRVGDDGAAVAASAARWLAAQSAEADPFHVCLSGGHTPRLLYENLAGAEMRDTIDWARWHVFFGDERAVPPTDDASNYHLAESTLLSQVPIPPAQVHRMQAERDDLAGAAAAYAGVLTAECGAPPRLSVVLLGLGPDGHTASLFPGSEALAVDDAWVTRGRASSPPVDRLTLTLPVLNNAAHVAFLVTGAEKRNALRGVIEGTVPAAGVRPHDGDLWWFLDAAAAASLD